MVKWKHFEIVHEEDKKQFGGSRKVPKVTDNHFNLGTSAKMRVSYAVQVNAQ